MQEKATAFVSHFNDIRYTVARAFEAQLEEFTTSVDSNANFGLDPRFGDQIKELHTKIDSIMINIDTVKDEAT